MHPTAPNKSRTYDLLITGLMKKGVWKILPYTVSSTTTYPGGLPYERGGDARRKF